jgi:SAM-dependent methyltransferase
MEFKPGNGDRVYNIDTTTEDYAKDQETANSFTYEKYLKPLVDMDFSKNILDVGCGVGEYILKFIEDGYNAYGIDLPGLSKFWKKMGNPPDRFLCCDASRLPFPNDYFDVVFSFGVIEHIGTKIGHCTLSDDYRKQRQNYAKEIIRVTKPGGRILISCPNKSFPIDMLHGPTDVYSPPKKIQSIIFKKTGMNVHPVWGENHLLSYPELKKLFCDTGGAREFKPLPLNDYFGFFGYTQGFKKIFATTARMYVNNLPGILRPTFMNPYLLAEITK